LWIDSSRTNQLNLRRATRGHTEMKIITDEACVTYSHPGHPERPQRVSMTLQKLSEQDVLPISWEKPSHVDDKVLMRGHWQHDMNRLQEPEDFDNDTPY